MYVVLGVSPVSEYTVAVEPVFGTIILHDEPPSIERWISYPVITRLPRLEGVFQYRLIWEVDTACAERFVGGCNKIGSDSAFAVGPKEEDISSTENKRLENRI